MYSWSFKGSHPTQIRYAHLVPPSPLLYMHPEPHVPPDSVLPAAWASDSMLPGVTWLSGSEVLVGGEVQTVGPSDRTIWTSDLT